MCRRSTCLVEGDDFAQDVRDHDVREAYGDGHDLRPVVDVAEVVLQGAEDVVQALECGGFEPHVLLPE